MKFLFHDDAGMKHLILKSDSYKYLIKVRRHKTGDSIALRRRAASETLYTYMLQAIEGRRAELLLKKEERHVVAAEKLLHIGWCTIDPKSVEKVLAQLSELGVAKITFIRCDRSQHQFKHDFERYNRILEASMQQSGRSVWIKLEAADSLAEFIHAYPQTVVLDFAEQIFTQTSGIDTVLIGCEGGFSDEERTLLRTCKTVRFDTPMILRSECAAVAAAAKVLL